MNKKFVGNETRGTTKSVQLLFRNGAQKIPYSTVRPSGRIGNYTAKNQEFIERDSYVKETNERSESHLIYWTSAFIQMNHMGRGEGRGKKFPSQCNSFKESAGVFYSSQAESENSINHSYTDPFPWEIAKKYPAVLNFRFLNLSSIKGNGSFCNFFFSHPLSLIHPMVVQLSIISKNIPSLRLAIWYQNNH